MKYGVLPFLSVVFGLFVSTTLAQVSQGTIAAVAYINNCSFSNFLTATYNFPNGTNSSLELLTPLLTSNTSAGAKFQDFDIPTNSIATLKPMFLFEIANTVAPILFTVDTSSLCTARLVCSGNLPNYNFTFSNFQCLGFNTTTTSGPTSTHGISATSFPTTSVL